MLTMETGIPASVLREENYTDIVDLVHYINEVRKKENAASSNSNKLYNNE